MPPLLEQQRRTDVIAIVFTLLLALPVALLGSIALGLAAYVVWLGLEPADEAGVYIPAAVFAGSLFIGFPFWFWLALKIRRAIGWPAHAFERRDYGKEQVSKP